MIFLLKVLLINDQLALAPNISYDNGFNTRFSLNLTYQFGTTSDTFSSLRSNNRDIRVYDPDYFKHNNMTPFAKSKHRIDR